MGLIPMKHLATALVIAGGLVAVYGVALIYLPAALILGGSALVAAGLYAEVD